MAAKQRSKRAPNWTNGETKKLIEAVFQRNSILKANHNTLQNAEVKKRAAWEEISDEVSSIAQNRRSIEECKTKLGNLLKDATKKINKYHKASRGTGYILEILFLRRKI